MKLEVQTPAPAAHHAVILVIAVAIALACIALPACRKAGEPLVEVGRWNDDTVAAVYIFYDGDCDEFIYLPWDER